MKRYTFPTVFFLLTLLNSIVAGAQKSHPVDVAIDEFATANSPERAYLHYDKSAYFPGETIWFKAYVMNEVIPAMDSKSFYTDWLDDKGKLLYRTLSPLVDGLTNGQFEIPADYKGAYIHVRAYTRWMLNFDSTFLYTKQIRVLGNEGAVTGNKTPAQYSLQFFPEGGDLIAGIVNRVAFKANDQWGTPAKITGILTDAQGKTIDSVRVQHDGMGTFLVAPEKGQTYSVKWMDEKKVGHTTALPAAKDKGFNLQVALLSNARRFVVGYSPELASTSDTIHLVGTMYQHEVFRISKVVAGEIKGNIPLASLPSGILVITVFDKSWNPVAERITYVDNGEYRFEPQMEVQRWGLNKRARNEIKISVPENMTGNLSVSVTDVAIAGDTSSNIISHLLLSSELKGAVYKPAYYFSGDGEEVARDLDLVMLTHGWRRFKWEDVLARRQPRLPYGRDTSYMSLSGKVLGVSQVSPGSAVVLILTHNKKMGETLLVPIKPDGTFNDPNYVIFDTMQVFYQFQSKELKKSSASIQFMADRLKAPGFRSTFGGVYGTGPDTAGSYQQWRLAKEAAEWAEKYRVKTLEAVIVKSKTKTPLQLMDEKYSSGLFTGGDGYQFDMVNDPFAASALSVFQYLQGKVAGLQITGNGSDVSLSWRNATPALFLNEMPADIEMLATMAVSDIAYVKVLRPPFMGAAGGGAGGAIAVYTRRGDDMKVTPGKGLSNNRVEGYSQIREFFSPNYSSFTPENEQRDLRTTLYWNPMVQVTPQKPSVLTFYNNDITRAFRVVIEGMTTDGKLAHVEQIME